MSLEKVSPLLAVALAVFAARAQAEDMAAEVTAAVQQRGQSQNVPSPPPSLQLLDTTVVTAGRINSLADIATAIPGITLTPTLNSSNTPMLYMRGQGFDNPTQITRDGAVGVYEDGFYIARPQQLLTLDLPDLDRIEVLHGPGGAFYGRNTSGGVVSLISKPPSGELHFTQSGDFGNRNRFRVLASADTPRWHDLSAKVTLLGRSVDGYVKNPLPDSHNYGEERQRAGRLQLRWDGLPSVRADYFLEKSNLDSTPAYDTNPYLNGSYIFSSFAYPYYADPKGPMTTTYRPVFLPLSTSNHVAQGLTVTWQPSTAFGIRSLTGYRTLAADERQDYAEFLGLANSTEDFYHQHQFSQDLQISGDLLDRQFSYSLGLSYFKEDGTHDRTFAVLVQSRLINTLVFAANRSEAAAVQLHWQPALPGRRLELTAAARYTKDSKDAERFESDTALVVEDPGAVNHLDYRRADPALTLSYRWTTTVSTYAMASSGYRAGGALESAAVGQFATQAFRPETLRSYEIGMKSSFWDGRLAANLAVFNSVEQNVQYALPVDAVTDQVYALRRATIRGADLGVQGTPIHDLALSASLAYLNWTLNEVDVLPGTLLSSASGSGSPYTVGRNINSLFALPYAPRYNFTVGGDYTFLRTYHSSMAAHIDYFYRGRFYSDAAAGPAVPGSQLDTIPAVGLLDARLSFLQDIDWNQHLEVSLWGKNVLNRKYLQMAGGYGSGVSQFTASAPVGWVARAGAWAEPATYGLSVRYEF